MCACVNIHIHVCVHECMYVCMCIYVYVCMRVCGYVRVWVGVCVSEHVSLCSTIHLDNQLFGCNANFGQKIPISNFKLLRWCDPPYYPSTASYQTLKLRHKVFRFWRRQRSFLKHKSTLPWISRKHVAIHLLLKDGQLLASKAFYEINIS